MAKKTLKHTKPRKGLFDKFEKVKTVRQGESLRFRDKNGRIVKFDGRKTLIAEIWLGNKRTNRVLNKTKRGQPVPQRFASNAMKKRILFSRVAKQGPRVSSEIKSKRFKIDAHHTITDNIEAKCPEVAEDTVLYTRRGNGSYVTMELTLKRENGEVFYEVISSVLKSVRRQYIFDELARLIIYRLYRNEMRASSKIDSALGDRARYVRSFEIKVSWDETKRLQEL